MSIKSNRQKNEDAKNIQKQLNKLESEVGIMSKRNLGPVMQRRIRKIENHELRYRLELIGHDELDEIEGSDLADYAICMINQNSFNVSDILEVK